MNSDSLFSPNWEKLHLEDFTLSFGDVVALKQGNQIIQGLVLDFSQDTGGLWYGICFLEKNKLFGRKIPSGFFKNPIDLLDLTYLNEDFINILTIKKNIRINFNKIGIGARWPANNIESFLQSYYQGIDARIKTKNTSFFKLFSFNPLHECYFDIEKILA